MSPSPSDIARAAAILARDRFEPPEECFHGFTTPRDCPNEVCMDRAVEWAWYVAMGRDPEFVLCPEDERAVGR